MRFVSAQGLAGFQDLGFVQAGFELVHRTGTLDFGNPSIDANRHLVGDTWDYMFSDHFSNWHVPAKHVEVVAGLPPCSAWSCFTGPQNRGVGAKALEHTWALVRYTARVKPDVVVYESVQQAYSQGRPAMLEMRQELEAQSGQRYDLHHVKLNNLMIGGLSYRPRYFWVAVRAGLPFSARADWPERVPAITDVIGDLADLDQTWSAQPYRAQASEWLRPAISASGTVDGHQGFDNTHTRRVGHMFAALRANNDTWHSGEGLSVVLKRIYDTQGKLPPGWEAKADKIIARDFDMGFSQPYRWAAKAWANVLTGGCLDMVVHPTRDRLITHREAARIQGLPDDWKIEPVKGYRPLGDTWGKAVSRNAGRWIAGHVRDTLDGTTTAATGELIGDREWLHATDVGFSRAKARALYFPGTRGGVTKHYNSELWGTGKRMDPDYAFAQTA